MNSLENPSIAYQSWLRRVLENQNALFSRSYSECETSGLPSVIAAKSTVFAPLSTSRFPLGTSTLAAGVFREPPAPRLEDRPMRRSLQAKG